MEKHPKPTSEKLGLKPGAKVLIVGAPGDYALLLGEVPDGLVINYELKTPADFIHFFAHNRSELESDFPMLKDKLLPNGSLWVSWPKSSSSVKSDLTENLVREIGLKNGLVDVKIVSIDSTWSALKFVYRLKDRA